MTREELEKWIEELRIKKRYKTHENFIDPYLSTAIQERNKTEAFYDGARSMIPLIEEREERIETLELVNKLNFDKYVKGIESLTAQLKIAEEALINFCYNPHCGACMKERELQRKALSEIEKIRDAEGKM